MSKALPLAAALIASLSIPAIANDEAASQAAFTAQLSANASAEQARKLLIAKDYKNVRLVDRDEDGRWVGTAVKNGKTTAVSIYLPANPEAPATN